MVTQLRSDKQFDLQSLQLEPETRKSSELESQYQNAYLQKLLPIDYLRVSELLTDRVLRIEAPQRKFSDC